MSGPKKTVDIISLVWQEGRPVAESLGIELWDVEWQREGGEWVLRIYIDREYPPVDHNLCENFSNQFGEVLDRLDPITEGYVLEVSSPGIERTLKKEEHFKRYEGSKIRLGLYSPYEGKKEYIGVLTQFQDGKITLQDGSKVIAIPLIAVAKANLVAEL